MDELSVHLKRLRKYTTIAIVICGIGWLLLPDYKGYILGLGIGIAVGFVNAYYLFVKIVQMTMIVEQKMNKRMNLGFFTRAAIAVLAVLWATKSESIEVSTTILGLLVIPVLTWWVGFIYARSLK